MKKGKFKSAGKSKRKKAFVVREEESSSECVPIGSAYESKSEVARIREQIEQEYRSTELLRSGFAMTSRHAFITARMNTIGHYRKQLEPLVGEDEATRMMCESCAKAANE